MGFQFTHGGAIQTIKLVVIFDHDMIKHLLETPLSDDQQVESLDQTDGITSEKLYKLSATVRETEQLFWWLLTCSYHVEVLEPHSLREKIKKAIQASMLKYAEK